MKKPGRKPDRARLAAVKVIYQVTEEDAFSNESAAWHLSAPELDARDRAFASALIFGTLSRQPLIDHDLTLVSSRPLDALDPWVRAVLRAGVWQLYFSYQVTPQAACDESVHLARFLAGEKATGFVNGLMRRLARSRPAREGPDADALAAGLTRGLYQLLSGWHGRETALAVGRSSLEPPAYLAIRPNALKDEGFRAWLVGDQALSFNTRQLPWPRSAYALEPGGRSVMGTEAYRGGLFSVQSQAAMMAGILADPRKGGRILDLCASPGGKTGHLAEQIGKTGDLTACDVSPAKVRLLEANMARLGHHFVRTRVHDATRLDPDFAGSFDLVICDVPCSGLGLLQKRPEIRGRVSRESIDRLRVLQGQILSNGARAVAPGGRLLYTTCTINPEENEKQVASFLDSGPGQAFELDWLDRELDQALGGAIPPPRSDRMPGTVCFMPHRDGTDGFYIARLRRKPQ